MKSSKAVIICVLILLCCAVLMGAILSVLMHRAAGYGHGNDADVLIVLGAQIMGDTPSPMLKGRLDAALTYLEQHPQTVCIVSGGQGTDEICSEAAVMEKYLLENGVAAERILREERSTDTHENIDFSVQIIEERGLGKCVAISTQGFHQYRAGWLVRHAGAEWVAAITSPTPFHLIPFYWAREWVAIGRLWIWHY